MLNGKSVLITGGTGTFGHAMTKAILEQYEPRRLIIFSRDGLKQETMRRTRFPQSCMRWMVGDVRDLRRLHQAFEDVDVIFHAAALKQILACEYNPFEAIKTNVLGSMNVIEAAIAQGVEKVVAISSDKSCQPTNIYGATKMCMERLFVNSTVYIGLGHPTVLGLVRYGNVAGSRGSVVHVFDAQRGTGEVTITDPNMTRFWFTAEEAVRFTLSRLNDLRGGEIFIPKLPSARIADVAEAIAPGCKVRVVGIRPGEKVHETLVAHGERAIDCGSYYIIAPSGSLASLGMGTTEYRSDSNSDWVTVEEIRRWWSEYKDSLQ